MIRALTSSTRRRSHESETEQRAPGPAGEPAALGSGLRHHHRRPGGSFSPGGRSGPWLPLHPGAPGWRFPRGPAPVERGPGPRHRPIRGPAGPGRGGRPRPGSGSPIEVRPEIEKKYYLATDRKLVLPPTELAALHAIITWFERARRQEPSHPSALRTD